MCRPPVCVETIELRRTVERIHDSYASNKLCMGTSYEQELCRAASSLRS
jgi:hypothetical protein